jgi:antitoxin component of RelBE/YafQ-DinJ toxin-antitoxin module
MPDYVRMLLEKLIKKGEVPIRLTENFAFYN